MRLLLPCLPAIAVASASLAAAQVRFVDELPGTFIDISSTGTNLNLVDDGEAPFTSTVGNSLLPAGPIRVGRNGGVRFGGGSSPVSAGDNLAPNNAALPANGAFFRQEALLPYWDDLDGGDVFVQEVSGRLIIQWEDVQVQGAALLDRMSFQVQVFGQGDVFAQLVYRSLGVHTFASQRGGSATIGYQGPAASSVQYSFDANNALKNGSALSLVSATRTTFIVDHLPGTFIDIAGVGTPLPLTQDDQVIVTTSVASGLLEGGVVRVGANGGVQLNNNPSTLGNVNAQLPSSQAFSGFTALLPFWDDLLPTVAGVGRVWLLQLHDRLVVQWDDVGFTNTLNPLTDRATFQVQIFHHGDIGAQFLYEDIGGARANGGAEATIGYQAGGIGETVQHSFNTPAVTNGTVLSVVFVGRSAGTSYCSTTPNSTGDHGRLVASGSPSLAANDLTLHASHLPPNSAAFFLVGTSAGFVANAGGSQGNLCLGGQIGRAVGGVIANTGSGRRAQVAVGLGSLPSPTGVFAASVGQTLSFQCWHRDGVGGTATSNLTNGVQIQFVP